MADDATAYPPYVKTFILNERCLIIDVTGFRAGRISLLLICWIAVRDCWWSML